MTTTTALIIFPGILANPLRRMRSREGAVAAQRAAAAGQGQDS